MDSLVRNTPLRFSRRVDVYEPLDQLQTDESGNEIEVIDDDDDHSHQYRRRNRTIKQQRSTRKQQRSPIIWSSLSYRRERARKRHIFLQSYKLESYDSSRRTKLKKIVVKVNSAMVSVLSFMWPHTLRPDCNSQSSIHVLPPTRIIRYC
ncbi:hypothetical protein RND71_013055 [Anisodus tanguticus]|uniref:Uncharacterized protein n=1 Tax=Anisodus tanguticus TaxID=243964 RepID=A0AAE1VGM9_9SOLA|nr:hypothetical protein RND71_013055 [Anisodus tanguticus]